MERVYLSIGANLGDPQAQCLAACARLDDLLDTQLIQRSGLYQTEPQGVRDQPLFVNLAVALDTDLSPRALLRSLQGLERDLGRVRHARWGPRTIDLDILIFGARRIRSAGLEVPHPRMHERRFVLAPLAEIAPALRHPVLGHSITELLANLGEAGGWVRAL